MSNQVTSVVRRVYIDKDDVLNFIQATKKWTPITALDEVINASPLFKEARQAYELGGDRA